MVKDQYSVLGKAPSSDDLKKLSSSDTHLTINHLSAGYGKMEILHNFDLFVSKAQSLCLIGPNGAGKSTLLRMMAGIYAPDQGKIVINGKNPYAFQMAQATTRDGKIFEYTADFVTDSLSVYTYIDGDLHFVERQREGETSVKYALYQNLEVTSVCGLEAFSIADKDFLFASSGCEMPKDNVARGPDV